MKLGDCEYRDDILYDPEADTWGKEEGSRWRYGVAPLLAWMSGGFTSVSLKPVGTRAGLGAVLGSVEGPKHFDVVRAPFECLVVATNPKAIQDPREVNRDPFGEGWLALLERVGPESRFASLGKAAPAIEEKLRSMRVHCFAEFPDVELQEIGVECSAVLVKLDETVGRSPKGTVVHVVSDDPVAGIELERWSGQTGNLLLETRKEGAVGHFLVKKS